MAWHSLLPFWRERGVGGARGEEKKEKERKKGMNNNVRFSFLFPKIL
jgi:hypothetical protein